MSAYCLCDKLLLFCIDLIIISGIYKKKRTLSSFNQMFIDMSVVSFCLGSATDMVIIYLSSGITSRESSEQEKRATLSVVREENRHLNNSVMILTYALMNGRSLVSKAICNDFHLDFMSLLKNITLFIDLMQITVATAVLKDLLTKRDQHFTYSFDFN